MAINYIGSDNITVFPAAKRVGYEESKRTTEDNLLKLNRLSSNAKNLNQMFEDPDDNAYIIFSIYGYYFRCLKTEITEIPSNANLTAYIKLENDPLNDIGWRLASTDDVVSALDDAGKFIGLAFTDGDIPDDEGSSEGIIGKYYGLSVTDEDGNLILQNLKLDSTEIRDGNADESIAEQFTTKALNVNGDAIINSSATTGAIFDVQADNVSKMRVVAPTGSVGIDTWLNVPSVYAITGQNDASINLTEYGTTIERNVNDTESTLIINKAQGTGNILKINYNSIEQFSVDINGTTSIGGPIYGQSLLNQSSASNAGIYVQNSGTIINREVADDNPVLRVTNSSSTSTGDILDLMSETTIVAKVTSEGNVGIGVDNPTEKLEVDGNIVATGDLTLNKVSGSENLITANYIGTPQFTVSRTGIINASALYALNGVSYAGIDVNDNGIRIAREIDGDTLPTLVVDKLTGTSNIIEIQYDSTAIVTIDVDGNINADGDVITTGNIYASSLLNTESGNSAKIDLTSVAGVTISNEDDVNHSTTLTVNKIEGNGNIIEATYGFEGDQDQPVKFYVDKYGNVGIAADAVYYGGGLWALNDANNAMIDLGTSGTTISRIAANHIPALTVSSFLGTGKIFDVKSGNTSRFAVGNDGAITMGSTTFTPADISKLKDDTILMGEDVVYVSSYGGTIDTDYSLFRKRLIESNTYEVLYTGRISIGLRENEFEAVVDVTLPGILSGLQYPNLQIRTQGPNVYTGEYVYASIKSGNNYFTITYKIPGSGTHPIIGGQDFDFSIKGIEVITT